jgi:hypothetical protein
MPFKEVDPDRDSLGLYAEISRSPIDLPKERKAAKESLRNNFLSSNKS